jgi:hypothetical protein
VDNFVFAQILAMNVEALSVVAEVEGMKAANDEREHRGEVIAYGEEAFAQKAHILSGIATQMQVVSRA